MNIYFNVILFLFIIMLSQSVHGLADGSVVIDRVIAVVNDEIITMSDLQRESSKSNRQLDERMLLEEMIDRKLQLAEAKQAGIRVSDKEIEQTVADIMNRNSLDANRFEAELAKEGLTLKQYKDELKEQLTISRVFNERVRSGLSVDEKEVRSYYEQHIDQFTLPEEIRVRHIFIKIPQNSTPAELRAAEQKAKNIYDRARTGDDFIQLVQEFSELDTASRDGDLGFIQRENALPVIAEASRSLKPGDLAGPLKTEAGYHIIRLEDIRNPIQPFEQAKQEVMKMLYQEKMENKYREWLQALRNDSHIEVRL